MPATRPVPERFRPALAALISLIATGDEPALRAEPKIRIRGDDPLLWVRDYPATLTALPPEGWDLADAVELADTPGTWSVVIPLWTSQEGRSDLSLEATINDRDDGPLITINNIHVQ